MPYFLHNPLPTGGAMKCWMAVPLLVAALVSCLAADATPPAAAVQELVFFGSTRPLRIRLQIHVDGKPFRAAWDAYLDQLFSYLDQDGDGVLNQEEAERAPKPQLLQQQLRGSGGAEMQMARRRTPEVGVKLVGGKVQRAGLASYYQLSGLQSFLVSTQSRDADSDRLTDALFSLFDQNQDGKLSQAELTAAEPLLLKLDGDDNEVITPDEIVPPADPERVEAPRRMQPLRADEGQPLFPLGGEDEASRLAYQLLSVYDKDRNEKLDATELGLPKAVFDELDANRDGKLSPKELEGWLQRPAAVTLSVRLGKRAENEPALAATADPAKIVTPAEGGVTITHEDARLDWRALAGSTNAFEATRLMLKEQFAAVDTDQNQYVDEKEAERVPFFQDLLVSADQDGDGKLTAKEFDAYLDVQAKAAGGSTSLSIRDSGRALFATLDANGDGKLGVRELRTVWQRLAALDRDGDGAIRREELPRQFHFTLAQGPPTAGGMAEATSSGMTRVERRPASRGPLWFHKMDRNGDGDVSRREFPGSSEEFQRLDADADGLLSIQEAERAEAQYRK